MNTYTISSQTMTATLSERGGELISLCKNGVEYMHDGNPKYWKSVAPVMFPICGRLYEGKYTYRGKSYEMNLHGFIRQEMMTVSEQSEDSITFSYDSTEKSRLEYPFDFTFKLTYTLKENTLTTAFTVENKTDGEIFFSLGGHPGFRLPLEGKGDFSDCYVEFSAPAPAKKINFSPTCFRTGDDRLFGGEALKRIDLKHDLFDDDAIFLYETAKSLTLASKSAESKIRMDFDGFKYIGLWHAPKTDANYVCIEPWTGSPAYDGKIDDLETKEDITRLEKGGVYRVAYDVTVEK